MLGPSQERDGIRVTTAYLRLAEHAAPVKVEFPAPVGEDQVRWIVDALAPRSVRGYPHALYLAHRTVRISDELMDLLCRAAGLAVLRGLQS